MKTTYKRVGTVKKVTVFAIINRLNELTNKQAEHFQLFTFKEKKPADYLAWLWNKEVKEVRYKVVSCVISYTLPSKKSTRANKDK